MLLLATDPGENEGEDREPRERHQPAREQEGEGRVEEEAGGVDGMADPLVGPGGYEGVLPPRHHRGRHVSPEGTKGPNDQDEERRPQRAAEPAKRIQDPELAPADPGRIGQDHDPERAPQEPQEQYRPSVGGWLRKGPREALRPGPVEPRDHQGSHDQSDCDGSKWLLAHGPGEYRMRRGPKTA